MTICAIKFSLLHWIGTHNTVLEKYADANCPPSGEMNSPHLRRCRVLAVTDYSVAPCALQLRRIHPVKCPSPTPFRDSAKLRSSGCSNKRRCFPSIASRVCNPTFQRPAKAPPPPNLTTEQWDKLGSKNLNAKIIFPNF